jgi:hypothetical protein
MKHNPRFKVEIGESYLPYILDTRRKTMNKAYFMTLINTKRTALLLNNGSIERRNLMWCNDRDAMHKS